jgi:hypothetical protein
VEVLDFSPRKQFSLDSGLYRRRKKGKQSAKIVPLVAKARHGRHENKSRSRFTFGFPFPFVSLRVRVGVREMTERKAETRAGMK